MRKRRKSPFTLNLARKRGEASKTKTSRPAPINNRAGRKYHSGWLFRFKTKIEYFEEVKYNAIILDMPKIQRIEKIRHSLAHILAMAMLEKFPNAKLGIGPVIENGFYYDFDFQTRSKTTNASKSTNKTQITNDDLPAIEKRIRELIKQNLTFKKETITFAEAKKLFANQPYKLELIKELNKSKSKISVYKTSNPRLSASNLRESAFTDLCRGPHIKNTSEIPIDAFKLTKIAGAYWKGNEKNPMLTRIYGVAFETKKELDEYLWKQAEAQKRDHRILGERLKLFAFANEVGPGLPLWLPKGTIIRDEIEKYAKEVEKEWGYERVATPHIAKEELYRMSGHIPYYKESMYPAMKLDDGNYYLKAMNCPHTHMIYRSQPRSYRELPIRYAEYGTVYRYELSGTLAGLLRVRGFTQNDAHIYCGESQAEEEFLKVMKLHEFWYKKVFGIKDFYMRLSLPAEDKSKYADIPKEWKKSVAIIKSALKKSGLPFVEAKGEAAFYGPKVDFQIKSVIGREETASTNQLDFLAAKRFNLTYVDKDGKNKSVYVIHRSPLGSHERFIAFLIEHFSGAFPLWLAPIQTQVLAISQKTQKYAEMIFSKLKENGVRVELTDSNETLGKRIREAEIQKIPYILVVGEKEMQNQNINVRHYRRGQEGEIKIEKLLEKIKKEISDKVI